MKKIYFSLMMILGMATLFSCSDDEKDPVVGVFKAPTLQTPDNNSSYVLTAETAADNMATFKWSAADFGFQSATTYALELAKAGSDFAEPIEMGTTNATTFSLTVGDMNNRLLAMGVAAGTAYNMEARIKATINDNVKTLYSEKIAFTATPYFVKVVYPSLYLPGNYQAASGYEADWSPDKAPEIFSLKSNEKYEGYIFFGVDNTEFKFTDHPNWDVNWGDTGADGTLNTDGDNIKIATAGYYLVKANINDLTYTVQRTDWGVIGSATPGGWDSDQDMTYDKDNKVLTLTVDLVVGEIKFRANDGWDLNYGDTGANGSLEAGGDNIQIAEAGNYTITLDLSKANYSYKVVKN
jgi:hypothetical protein